MKSLPQMTCYMFDYNNLICARAFTSVNQLQKEIFEDQQGKR